MRISVKVSQPIEFKVFSVKMDVKQHNIFICVIFRTLSNMVSKLSLFDTIYS